LERLRFWNGRFLIARDLRDQQEDLIRRLEYHQSFAHGEGILCGFQVTEHPRPECRDKWLVVEPGMGYDCCGRTLWMPQSRVVEIEIPRPQDDEDKDGEEPEEERSKYPEQPPPARRRAEGPVPGVTPAEEERPEQRPEHEAPGQTAPSEPEEPQWFVLACHTACPTDPLPALYTEDLCNPVRHEHGRLREDVTLKVVPASEVSEACWPRRRTATAQDCWQPVESDCGSRFDGTPCQPRCDCGECLVLAAVWREPGTGRLGWTVERRKVLGRAGNLTRITQLSWPHGGELSARDLLEKDKGQLTVRFSRPLQPTDGLKSGINFMTFTVSFLGPTRSYEQIIPPEADELHGRPATPRLSDNKACAIFDLDPDMLRGRTGYGGTYLHIRLLCDFILDCHGRAVSGAHFGGDVTRQDSGDRVPGGVFESWFYLTTDWRGGRR
jgi:hypothetical protein